MKDKQFIWASLVMITAIALGAFGAHALRSRIDATALAQWHTGVLYQMVHGLALFGSFAAGDRIAANAKRWSTVLFVLGVFLFSGSLYALSTRTILGTQGLTPLLGPLTPLGGLCFIAGWVVLLRSALAKR